MADKGYAEQICEQALISIYNEGYNKAIEDACDYLFSIGSPNLSQEQLANLDLAFGYLKKAKYEK